MTLTPDASAADARRIAALLARLRADAHDETGQIGMYARSLVSMLDAPRVCSYCGNEYTGSREAHLATRAVGHPPIELKHEPGEVCEMCFGVGGQHFPKCEASR